MGFFCHLILIIYICTTVFFPKETLKSVDISDLVYQKWSEGSWFLSCSVSPSVIICFENTLIKSIVCNAAMLCFAMHILTHQELSTYHLVDRNWLAGHLVSAGRCFAAVPGVHGSGSQWESRSSSSCLPWDKASQVQLLFGSVVQLSSCAVSSEASRPLLDVCSDFQNNFCPPPCSRND